MADEKKKLTLHNLKPDEFKVWEVTTRATWRLHKLLNMVEGIDPDPTPCNPDGTAGIVPPALCVRTRHGWRSVVLIGKLD